MFRCVTACCFVLFCVALVFSQSPPQKTTWPVQFSVVFGMSYKSPNPLNKYTINNATSSLYYDFTPNVEAQLIDYPTFCIPGVAPNSEHFPCKLYFNNTGIFYVSPENNIPCCTMILGVGAVPPNFLEGFTYKNNQSANDYYGVSHECYHWEGSTLADQSFGYWTNIFPDSTWGYQDDIQFKDGPTGVFWNFAPFVNGPQDPDMFNPPAECTASCTATEEGNRLLSIHKHMFA